MFANKNKETRESIKIHGLSEVEKKTHYPKNVKIKCKNIFEQQRLIITQL